MHLKVHWIDFNFGNLFCFLQNDDVHKWGKSYFLTMQLTLLGSLMYSINDNMFWQDSIQTFILFRKVQVEASRALMSVRSRLRVWIISRIAEMED